jgi:enoyl-CoA hydratase/carnithine racemase
MSMAEDIGPGVSLSVADAAATIWFDRPGARNAMLYRSWCKLPELIAAVDGDPRVGAVILRGSGGHFGAGNDIAEFASLRGNASAARDYGWAMARGMRAVETAAKPVIAAIEGCCFGASVALALAADLRIAPETARFGITPAKLGAVYLRSDHHRLVAAVGPGAARQLIYTARSIDAARAGAIGLVDDIYADHRFDLELAALIDTIASGSPHTLTHSKRMLRGAGCGEATEESEESIGWFVDAMLAQDFAEGTDAFLSKRSPIFTRA